MGFPKFRVRNNQTPMSRSKVSLPSQILTLIDSIDFKLLVRKFDTDKHLKGIETRTYFVSMLFMQLASVSSLRDITNGLRSATGDLNHLGLGRAPSKSTLSYINKHRDYGFFEALYF